MNNKQRLSEFPNLKRKISNLEGALFDIICDTKFPFRDRVVCKYQVVDPTWPDPDSVIVSVSHRPMKVYMVRFCGGKRVVGVEIFDETDIEANRENYSTTWKAIRMAIWVGDRSREQSS